MSNKKIKANPSLGELIEKFSQSDVIAEMEKEYQSVDPTEIPLSEIDDSPFLKRVEPNPTLIEQIVPSVEAKGLFQPLVVRRVASHYELILGRKRYFAAKKAGLEKVPSVIRDADDEETLLILLADTRDRREGNVVEMAVLYEALANRFGYTRKTLATLSHQSRSQVVNSMRILALPDYVVRKVSRGELSYGHARALCPLSRSQVDEAIKEIENGKLSVRETEKLALQYNGKYQQEASEAFKRLGAERAIEQGKSIHVYFKDKDSKEEFIRLIESISDN